MQWTYWRKTKVVVRCNFGRFKRQSTAFDVSGLNRATLINSFCSTTVSLMVELLTEIRNSCTKNHDKSLGYWKQNMSWELKLKFSSTAVLLIACVWTTFFSLHGKKKLISSPQQRFIITLTVFRFFNLREDLDYRKGKFMTRNPFFSFLL